MAGNVVGVQQGAGNWPFEAQDINERRPSREAVRTEGNDSIGEGQRLGR